MAKIKQGIFGAVQGKIGNLVGSTWKGTPVLKSKAASVANPQTAAQVAQRDAMSGSVMFAKILLASWIKPLWDRFAVRMSGYNAWIQANVPQFVDPVAFTPTALVMSIGNMAVTQSDSVDGDKSDGNFVITWTPDTTGFHLASDIAYICIYNETRNQFVFQSSAARSAGTATIAIPANWLAEDNCHSWLVFKRTNGLYVSLDWHTGFSIVA